MAAPPRLAALGVIAVVLMLSLLISAWARWYEAHVSLPRYCGDITGALVYLERVIVDDRPAGAGGRRPYVVAAKLLFLMPRHPEEAVAAYLARVERRLRETCR